MYCRKLSVCTCMLYVCYRLVVMSNDNQCSYCPSQYRMLTTISSMISTHRMDWIKPLTLTVLITFKCVVYCSY